MSKEVLGLAVFLYALQMTPTGIPNEVLTVAEHIFFTLETLFAYESISLPAAALVSGLLIYADDWINSTLLGWQVNFGLEFSTLAFACIVTLIYFIRPAQLQQPYSKAVINLCKGQKSSSGCIKFAYKLLGKHGLTSHSFKLLYSVLFIKLGFTSIIHYVYAKLTRQSPPDLRKEVRSVAFKCLLLVGVAFVFESQGLKYALGCDLMFMWWYAEKTLHNKPKDALNSK